MSHETLQALYALDVAEVGEVEAAKRWEWVYSNRAYMDPISGGNGFAPTWDTDSIYRRKPGIPWPKVMMQPDSKPVARWNWRDGKLEWLTPYRAEFDMMPMYFAPPTTDTKQEWPADAPEWANAMIVVFWDGKTEYIDGKQERRRIERPKPPALKKIDWSKLPLSVRKLMVIDERTGKYEGTSGWIAWNCDENTRGNPLPDGLVVEWVENGFQTHHTTPPIWSVVRCFRIVGIQEGWE